MNSCRDGNFTSSEIVALTSNGKEKGTFGKPALTYIDECNIERRLGRSLSDDFFSKPTSWGSLVENRAHHILGLNYKLCSEETLKHPDFDCWFGSPDGFRFEGDVRKAVTDIKCPFTLKSFVKLVQPLYDGLTGVEAMNAIRFGYTDNDNKEHEKHSDGEKFYWQLISNAIITGLDLCELIIFCPYRSELETIRFMASQYPGENSSRFMWINSATDDELPFLPDGGFYKNLNVIAFPVPESDKALLTGRVRVAKDRLIKVPELVIA